jgi:hypothetical protein
MGTEAEELWGLTRIISNVAQDQEANRSHLSFSFQWIPFLEAVLDWAWLIAHLPGSSLATIAAQGVHGGREDVQGPTYRQLSRCRSVIPWQSSNGLLFYSFWSHCCLRMFNYVDHAIGTLHVILLFRTECSIASILDSLIRSPSCEGFALQPLPRGIKAFN